MRSTQTTPAFESRVARAMEWTLGPLRRPRLWPQPSRRLLEDLYSMLVCQRRFWMLWDGLLATMSVPLSYSVLGIALDRANHAPAWQIAPLFGMLLPLLALAVGLYERQVFTDRWRAVMLGATAAALTGGAAVLANWLLLYQPLGRTIVIVACGLCFVGASLPRTVVSLVGGQALERLAVVGEAAASMIRDCSRQTDSNTEIAVTFSDCEEPRRLAVRARRAGAQQVVVAPGCNSTTLDQMVGCIRRGLRVTGLVQYIEQRYERVPAELIDLNWVVDANIHTTRPAHRIVKRTGDILTSGLALTASLPVTLVLAVLIKTTTRGPLFYVQTRVGQHGRHFRMIKFRTMCVDAEAPGQAVWAQKNDPRVTRVGQFMRKTRLDELPQFINVLKGDMAVVGPRPERPAFERHLVAEIPHYRLRHLVKPGITGWAQVNYQYGASTDDALVKHHYDLYYIKYFTPILDLMILLRTGGAIFRGAR
jgi:exopolysaccharide biosynthesis polyprenyl glycosylphosphotransferase